MAKKLKDLGGKKYKEFSSISAAQKAGSIYYGKKLKSGKIKKMAAVLTSDLGKGQSLNSFMNKQLKSSRAAGMKPIVDPDGQNVGKDYYTNPEKIAGISREKMLEIIDKGTDKKPKVKAKGVNPFSSQRASVAADAAAKPKVKVKAKLEVFIKKPASIRTLEAFKAGTLKLTQRDAFRLIKSLKRYNKKNPKDKVLIPGKLKKLGAM